VLGALKEVALAQKSGETRGQRPLSSAPKDGHRPRSTVRCQILEFLRVFPADSLNINISRHILVNHKCHFLLVLVGLTAETDNSQRHLDNNSRQQLKLKDRQRFFEEVYQHDVDNYLPSTHLQIDCRKPPMGSISSMEVNVDVLEQMDLMDISDQEALDVFLNSSSGPEEAPLTPSLPGSSEQALSHPGHPTLGLGDVPLIERLTARRLSNIMALASGTICRRSSGPQRTFMFLRAGSRPTFLA
uniref:Uncharacterized protein n=1 Tax=Neogobius melanostomus TaxID=47308 RepID=A0A8C6UQW4_9GOBI